MSLPEFLLPSPVCCSPHPTNHVVLCFFPCLFFFSALRASLGKRRLRLGSRWGENSKTTDRITQDTARVQSSKIERVKVKFGSSAPCASVCAFIYGGTCFSVMTCKQCKRQCYCRRHATVKQKLMSMFYVTS